MTKKMEQFTIFGTVEEVQPPKPKNRYKTMQEMFGVTEGKTCKTCFYLVKKVWDKTYYKCGLWRQSNSKTTDIHLKNQACGKYLEFNQPKE